MDIEPTFKERKTSDIQLGFHKTKNAKEMMDFMRKNVEEIREYYARKRAKLYEDEGFLINLLISEFNNSLRCSETHARQKGELNMAELLYLIELNTRK